MWFMSNSHFCKTQTTRRPSETETLRPLQIRENRYSIKHRNSHKTSDQNGDIPVETTGYCEARTCRRSEFFKEDPTPEKTVAG